MLSLKPGCHFFKSADGYWYLVDGDERAFRISISDAIASNCFSEQPLEGSDHDSLTALFKERGALNQEFSTQNSSQERLSANHAEPVLILGKGKIANSISHTVKQHLPGVSLTIQNKLDSRPPHPSILVALSLDPRDEFYKQIDSWCATKKIPWTRCCLEGNKVSISPIAVSEDEATYTDLRSRRLAASKIGDVLENLWKHLDTKPFKELSLSAGVENIVVGLLSEIIIRTINKNQLGLPCNQEICIDINTLEITRHPVLPIPPLMDLNLLSFKDI